MQSTIIRTYTFDLNQKEPATLGEGIAGSF